MNKITAKRLVLALIVANLCFIWGNSCMDAGASGDMSGSVLALIGKVFPFLLTEAGHALIRKIAHFSEFACLGLLWAGYRTLEDKPPLSCWGFGLAAACIDETIQLYVPGRASSLTDVWIDTAGFCTGLLILVIGYRIITQINIRRKS